MTCDVLSSERGPSCSKISHLTNCRRIHIRFIKQNIFHKCYQNQVVIVLFKAGLPVKFWSKSLLILISVSWESWHHTEPPPSGQVHYQSHHYVLKEDKSTTKYALCQMLLKILRHLTNAWKKNLFFFPHLWTSLFVSGPTSSIATLNKHF